MYLSVALHIVFWFKNGISMLSKWVQTFNHRIHVKYKYMLYVYTYICFVCFCLFRFVSTICVSVHLCTGSTCITCEDCAYLGSDCVQPNAPENMLESLAAKETGPDFWCKFSGARCTRKSTLKIDALLAARSQNDSRKFLITSVETYLSDWSWLRNKVNHLNVIRQVS